MMNNNFLNILAKILRPCNHPPVPNLQDSPEDYLYSEGLTRGTGIIGEPASGKSTGAANHRVDYDINHPGDASFSFDKSGSYTDDYLNIAYSDPRKWEKLKHRIKYIRLGDPDWVVPFPEFSPLYGTTYREQISRVQENFSDLLNHAEEKAPILAGGALKAILPNVCYLAVAQADVRPSREPFQITEVMAFIERPKLMVKAIARVRGNLPQTVTDFLYTHFINVRVSEQEMKSYALTEVSSSLGLGAAFAHLAADRPIFTFKQAIENGWIVLIDATRIATQKAVQDYLMVQLYSLLMEQIVKRIPHDPTDNKVAIIVDEVRAFLKIPGMAEELGEISQIYRSRGTQPYIIIQTLAQLDEDLEENFWGIGNLWIYALRNKKDAEKVAYQLIKYNPQQIKQRPRTDTQNPTTEPVQGQDRLVADWLTSLKNRECVMRRYISEQEPDRFVRHVAKTKDAVLKTDQWALEKLKDALLRANALPVDQVTASASRRLQELTGTERPKI